MLRSLCFRASVLTLAVAPSLVLAGVYKCLDDNNKVVYQDRACRELTPAPMSAALSRLAPQATQSHLFWKASAERKSLYFLGSLSYGSGDMYPLPESIVDRFQQSDVLVMATEFDKGADTDAVGGSLAGKGIYTDGSNLEQHVKASTWSRVAELAKKLDVSLDAIGMQKPWMAALTLRKSALLKAGLDVKLGVDRAMLEAAKMRKLVVRVDPVDEQLKAYEGLPDAAQEQLLLRVLGESDGNGEYFKSLIEAWKKGDARSLELAVRRMVDLSQAGPVAAEPWWIPRNEALIKKLDELATDGRTYFVVVDTERLVGEKGLLRLLEGRGYELSQF